MRQLRSPMEKTTRVLGYVFIFTFALAFLSPLLSTVLAAFRTDGDLLSRGIFAMPHPVYLGGFRKVWMEGKLFFYFRNSLIVTVGAVGATVVCAALAAHALARFNFLLRGVVLLLFLGGLFFPPQVYIIPIYFLADRLGIYNTYAGLIAVHLAYQLPFSIFLLRGFFRTVPSDLLDAARIDGAGEVRTLLRIVLPLSAPAIGGLSILLFTWIWNDYFWALAMTDSLKAQTIMIGIAAFRGRVVFNWNSEAASSFIAMLPPLLVFLSFQRFFVKGIRMGGIR